MKKKILSLTLAAVMVLGLAACGGGGESSSPEQSDPGTSGNVSTSGGGAAGEASGTFTVGVIGPTTGGAAIYGTAVLNAAQIAVEEINALGGPVQFNLISADDTNDPETAVNAYNSLMDQDMQILLGTVTTKPALAVVPDTYADRVFTLTPSGSGDDVIENNDNVFQVCFTDSNQGTRSAQYMDEHFDDLKIAIIYRNDDQHAI